MAYVSTRTWLPGDTFPHTDHNTYIRDNLKAIRTFQHVGQPIVGSVSLVSVATATVVVSLLNIEPVNIDEPWMLQVVAICTAYASAACIGTITMEDNVAAALTVIPSTFQILAQNFGYPVIAVGTKGPYTANSAKPGFKVKIARSGGTGGNAYVTAFAYCRPTTTIVKP